MRVILTIFGALACAAAALREARLAIADAVASPGSLSATRDSLRFAPDDAARWRKLGVAAVRNGEDGAAPYMRRALELHPQDSEAALALGFDAETRGELAVAEAWYSRAAQASRRFQPRYARAAFYFRAGRAEEFWSAASDAANIPGADIRRILVLAEKTAGMAETARLLKLREPGALLAFVEFALQAGEVGPACSASDGLAVNETTRPLLLRVCEKAAEVGRMPDAVRLWNRVSPDRLDPAAGRSLADPAFREGAARPFGWTFGTVDGVAIQPELPSGVRIDLSGSQPERFELMHTFAPVLPGRTYVFRSKVGDDGTEPHSLAWRFTACAERPEDVPLSGAAAGHNVAIPPSCNNMRVSLVHARAVGKVRMQGTVALDSAALELLP